MPKKLSYFIWLAAVVVIVIVLFWILGFRTATKLSENGQPDGDASSSGDVAIRTLPGGWRSFEDRAAGYAFTVPANWYLEKRPGNGIAAYPDYAPGGGTQPECKIEIAALANPTRASLDDWLDLYLRADPTSDVVEADRSASQISAHDAVLWSGTLNGVSTTLEYIARGDSVIEIAPSVIGQGQEASSDGLGNADLTPECRGAFEALLENFSILP